MGRDYGEHGRCEAHSKTAGRRCKQPATDSRGKCHYHGGATPLKNGIYSDVVRDEDRAVLDALEDLSTASKLEDTLNLQVMKLRRAVELTGDPEDEMDFWGAFMQLVDGAGQGGELDPALVRELANMLQTPERAQRDLMDLIRKTAKTLHDITDDSPERVEHAVDTDQLDEIRGLVDDAY